MVIAPRRDPNRAPVRSTTNVCPVIGTGPIGNTICAERAIKRLKPRTTPTERTQSSGASAVPINVSGLAKEVLIVSSTNFRLSLHQFLVCGHSPGPGVRALFHDGADTHAVERTPHKENRDEKEYRSQNVSDSSAVVTTICNRYGQFNCEQSKKRSELDHGVHCH